MAVPISNCQGVLLDIEGTTSAVSYVYDVMFPFAAERLDAYLANHWQEETTQAAAEQIAKDAGHASLAIWGESGDASGAELVAREVRRLMEADVKSTGLKKLQGLIWQSGFESGELRAHVFDDVPPALRQWQAAGVDLRIYSSGSIHAQKLFFGHSEAGDLRPHFSGHYDTTTGNKKDAASYQAIAHDWQLQAAAVLFLSDIPAELDAAATAGMQTALVIRPGNAPVDDANGHPAIKSFSDLSLL